MGSQILPSQKLIRHVLSFRIPSSIRSNQPYANEPVYILEPHGLDVEWQGTSPPPASSEVEVETLPPLTIIDSPASPDPPTSADDDTDLAALQADDDPEYVDYCPYPEKTSATDSLPELSTVSASPKASASMAGQRSPTPPTATWPWSSSSGDGDDNNYRVVVDDCSEAVVRHVRRTMNTCCTSRVANEVRASFGVLMREAMEPAFVDNIVNEILQ